MTVWIEAQGGLLLCRETRFTPKQVSKPPLRGKVTGFSRGSRKRLLRLFARMETKNVRAVFVTLTFKAILTCKEAKQALKRFMMRVRRKFPAVSGVWRMELQPERGAPHFHIIFYGLPYWKQADLQKTWEACTREQMSIVHIKLLRGRKRVMYYVSKYCAKVASEEQTSLDDVTYQHASPDGFVGRAWGYINYMWLPFARIHYGVITSPDVWHYLRWCVKPMSHFRLKRVGRCFALFADDAYKIYDTAIRWGGMDEAVYNSRFAWLLWRNMMVACMRRLLLSASDEAKIIEQTDWASRSRQRPERVALTPIGSRLHFDFTRPTV